MSVILSRARPLLGTLVAIQVETPAHDNTCLAALDEAWKVVEHVARVMSAHDEASDLGRMSRADAGQVLSVDQHTVQVLQAAQTWSLVSCGAFNPARAGAVLARRGERPGLAWHERLSTRMDDVEILSADRVRMRQAVALDFGGIAKGYALDQAADVLSRHGCADALINGGGDLRVVGQRRWPVDVRHAGEHLRDRPLREITTLTEGAMATSVADARETAFVRTVAGRGGPWRSATVLARDCLTADVLTKWALQASPLCPRLRSTLRLHGARMWRT
jgi:thiamine biosynthesis lipoprotein